MRKINITVLLISILSFTEVYSQSNEKNPLNPMWVEAGLGVFTHRAEPAIGQSYWLNYSSGNTIYKVRYQKLDEFQILGPDPQEYTKGLALMMGKKRGNDIVHIAASGGLGISTGITRGKYLYTNGGILGSSVYETKTFSKVSIPLEVDFVFKPFRYFGMGLALTGDINAERSSVGLLFKAGLGLYR